jgi:hypothetical protein
MSKVSLTSTATQRSRAIPGSTSFSEAERARVFNHIEDVFLSPAFRNSKRYSTLLRYVVERTLDGQADQLKERTIGVEAFGRPADYDTNADHSVRSTAGEVRRRLAQYYAETGSNTDVRIEMPPGAYVPQIRFIEREAPSEEIESAQPSVGPRIVAIPRGPAEDWAVSGRDTWLGRKRAIIAGVILLVAAATLAAVNSPWRATSAFDQFWDPILASPNAALLCFGGGGAVSDAPVTLGDLEHSPMRRMNVSDALSLAAVTGTLRSKGKPYRVLNRANATSFQDLRQGPFILIGALNNEWSLRLTSGLRFTFGIQPPSGYIKDRNDPSNTRWSFSLTTPLSQPTRDYAIITRLRDPLTQQSGLVVAGIGGWGTQAAGEFVSSPDEIRKIDSLASGWARKNLQIVVATDIIRGSSGPPVVLAVHTW